MNALLPFQFGCFAEQFRSFDRLATFQSTSSSGNAKNVTGLITPPPPPRGDSHKKRTEVLVGKFEKNP